MDCSVLSGLVFYLCLWQLEQPGTLFTINLEGLGNRSAAGLLPYSLTCTRPEGREASSNRKPDQWRGHSPRVLVVNPSMTMPPCWRLGGKGLWHVENRAIPTVPWGGEPSRAATVRKFYWIRVGVSLEVPWRAWCSQEELEFYIGHCSPFCLIKERSFLKFPLSFTRGHLQRK